MIWSRLSVCDRFMMIFRCFVFHEKSNGISSSYNTIYHENIIHSYISVFSVSLSAQQRDSRVREYLSPTRIVWQQESQLIQGAEHLLLPGNGQSDLANRSICKLASTDRQHPAILFDFGKELQGGLQIVTGMPSSHEPVTIRVRFGESVSEAMCDIDGENGATNDHAMRDFTVRLPWLGVMEVGNSGFRFVRIDSWTILPNCI